MAKYKPLEGESIYDVAVKLYGNMALGVQVLLAMNTVNINANLPELTYDENASRETSFYSIPKDETEATYVPLNGESIFDIAVKLYKDATLGIEQLLTNNDITLSDNLEGLNLKYPKNIVRLKPVIDIPKIQEATLFTPTEGQSIYDVAVTLYGSMSLGIEKLLNLNPINLTTNIVGMPLAYDVAYRTPEIITVPRLEGFDTYLTRTNQSVYDLAIQLYNDLNRLDRLLTDHRNLNDLMPIQTVIQYTKGNGLGTVVCTDVKKLPAQWNKSIYEQATALDIQNAIATLIGSINEGANALEFSSWSGQFFASILEATNSTELIQAIATRIASLIEATTATESTDRFLVALRSVTEAATATEAQNRFYLAYASLNEGATAQETINGVLGITRSVFENITATDTANGILVALGTINESAAASETITVIWSGTRSISETASASETQNRFGQYTVTILETTSASDSENGTRIMPKSISEPTTATDAPDRNVTAVRSISEAGSASDTLNGGQEFYGRVDEGQLYFFNIVEYRTIIFNSAETKPVYAWNETETAIETQDRQHGIGASDTESVSSSHSQSTTMVAVKSITDAAIASDTQNGVRVMGKSQSEAAAASDTQDRLLSISRSVSESASASDSQSATVVAQASITEATTASHSQNKVGIYELNIYGHLQAAVPDPAVVYYRINGGTWVTWFNLSSTTCGLRALIGELDSGDVVDIIVEDDISNSIQFRGRDNSSLCPTNITGTQYCGTPFTVTMGAANRNCAIRVNVTSSAFIIC